MATKDVNAKQKEIIARKLGYEGPMQGFDEFLKSDPALSRKFGLVLDKYMARGGMAKKYASGGLAYATQEGGIGADQYYENIRKFYRENPNATAAEKKAAMEQYQINQEDVDKALQQGYGQTGTSIGMEFASKEGGIGQEQYYKNIRDFVTANPAMTETERLEEAAKYGISQEDVNKALQGSGSKIDESGKPGAPEAPIVQATKIEEKPEQLVTTVGADTKATTATAADVADTALAEKPTEKEFTQVTAATTAADTAEALKKLTPAQGTVSEQAQVTAETMEPTSTALADIKAAEGVARQVEGAPTREEVAGEMVSGPAVDQARIETELAKTQAAQGTVTEEMTVQGQLNKLLADFDAKNPPPWAAASMRSVTAVLAERGLGASSLAGQAIIQATMESALPIATADAATYREMEAQNLSNRQQTAMLLAQQRAQFLGQEFDQAFQTRVLNAAKVADIANMNFNAQTQIALENARLAQTMDLANLNNKQAVVMANAAQIANLEMANLNNRQQAAVINAQAFLQMDMQNLSNEQQMEMFKAQSTIQSIFTDTAMENAVRQFNSTGEAQTSQFFAGLATQVNTFNASQMNAMEEFRVSQENALATFNATAQNQRDQFNADFRRIIDQSNAEWRRNIATINTQTQNQMAMFNAQNALQVSMAEYNNLWQGYRDDIEMAWKSGESSLDRDNAIALQVISKEAQIQAAKLQADALKYQVLGQAAATLVGKTNILDTGVKIIKDIFGGGTVSSLTKDLTAEDWNKMGVVDDDFSIFDNTSEIDNILELEDDDTDVTIEDAEDELYGGG